MSKNPVAWRTMTILNAPARCAGCLSRDLRRGPAAGTLNHVTTGRQPLHWPLVCKVCKNITDIMTNIKGYRTFWVFFIKYGPLRKRLEQKKWGILGEKHKFSCFKDLSFPRCHYGWANPGIGKVRLHARHWKHMAVKYSSPNLNRQPYFVIGDRKICLRPWILFCDT